MITAIIVHLFIACVFANYVGDVKGDDDKGHTAGIFLLAFLVPLLAVPFVLRIAKADNGKTSKTARYSALGICYVFVTTMVVCFVWIFLLSLGVLR